MADIWLNKKIELRQEHFLNDQALYELAKKELAEKQTNNTN